MKHSTDQNHLLMCGRFGIDPHQLPNGFVFHIKVNFHLDMEGRKEMVYLTMHSTHFYLVT